MKEERIFKGMFRPEWKTPQGYILCTCGTMLQNQQITREHWQMGHFDTPVYEDLDNGERE